jgi:hypothetical protein
MTGNFVRLNVGRDDHHWGAIWYVCTGGKGFANAGWRKSSETGEFHLSISLENRSAIMSSAEI